MNLNGHFDYIFIGAGASTTLLLRSMESRGLLNNKKIGVIDSDNKSINDKTYCFWSSKDESISKHCEDLFSQTWPKISVNRGEPETLENSHYVHISSIVLYDECRRLIKDYELSRIYTSVSALIQTDKGVLVRTGEGDFQAELVFDSRPPSFAKPEKNEVLLWQTFVGHIISPNKAYSQIECVDLMDFEIPQQGFTQFMYVLPLPNNRILVEMTRFGKDPLTSKQAEPVLADYILQRFGDYEFIETEKGTIPMSTAKIVSDNIAGVIPIGGRSGAIKPSTGYAFKKMFQAAEHISDRILRKKEITLIKPESKRFQFYDRLLLLILLSQPTLGKTIFSLLFKKNSISSVFQFLDGKTNIFQDLRILFSLPVLPFLKVLRFELNVWFVKHQVSIFNLSLALLILFVQHFDKPFSFYLQLSIFTVGFILVGLPHGAVDYLLEKGIDENHIKFRFVLRYLSYSFLFLGIWVLSADFSLLVFLAYSMWHFGQCDFKTWFPDQTSALKIFIWGFLLLAIILIGHQTETNMILSSLNTIKLNLSIHENSFLLTLFLLIAFLWSAIERNASFFLTVSMLFIANWLPLMSAFSLYFIGQHSINGWIHLKFGLQTNNSKLYLKSLPFNLGAIGLLAFSYWLTQKYLGEKTNLFSAPLFFVFLSCISFPHIIWINRFYVKK